MTLATGKAFTLIEIMLVVAIIGISLAISLPNLKKTFNTLQLNSFAQDLQSFMNYLHQRSIVEREIIYLTIDNERKECWARLQKETKRLKTYHIPKYITIQTDKNEIVFYPDGSIDKVSLKLTNPDNKSIALTTEGVFGSVKLQSQT